MRSYVFAALLLAAACSPTGDLPTSVQPHFIAVGPGKGNSPDRFRVWEHSKEDFTLVVAGCLSEPLVVSGSVNTTLQDQDNPGDRAHFRMHTNLQGVTGITQVTGTQYHLAQVHNATINNTFPEVMPFETTQVFRYRLIGSGPLNNSMVDISFKMTINANGETTVSFFRAEAKCGEEGNL